MVQGKKKQLNTLINLHYVLADTIMRAKRSVRKLYWGVTLVIRIITLHTLVMCGV